MTMKKTILILLATFAAGIAFGATAKLTGKEKKAREIYAKARLIADDKEKIAQLKEALVLDPDFEACYWLIADTYKQQGNMASCLAYYERAAKPKFKNYSKTFINW